MNDYVGCSYQGNTILGYCLNPVQYVVHKLLGERDLYLYFYSRNQRYKRNLFYLSIEYVVLSDMDSTMSKYVMPGVTFDVFAKVVDKTTVLKKEDINIFITKQMMLGNGLAKKIFDDDRFEKLLEKIFELELFKGRYNEYKSEFYLLEQVGQINLDNYVLQRVKIDEDKYFFEKRLKTKPMARSKVYDKSDKNSFLYYLRFRL